MFLIVSAHFTPILHLCVREANKALPEAGMSIYSVDSCHSRVIVGGLKVVLALVEGSSKVEKVEVLSLLTSTFVSPAPDNTSSCFNYSYSERVSPVSVEKYVLNETFLI